MFNTNNLPTLAALAVLALVGLIVAIYLAIGLFQARSLIRREFSAYFLSPIAYVVLVVFLVVTGYLFFLTLGLLTERGPDGAEFPMRVMLGDGYFWLVFLFIPPLLTMRLFAEERSTGTLEQLMTTPLREWQIVLSKYVACLAFYVVLWLPTLVYLPVLLDLRAPVWNLNAFTPWAVILLAGLGVLLITVVMFLLQLGTTARIVSLVLLLLGGVAVGVGVYGHYWLDGEQVLRITAGIDPMPVLSSYLGVFLAGAMFLALGIFVSSLVRSQMVAALVSLVLCLPFIVPGFWRPSLGSDDLYARVLDFVAVPVHFSRDFSRGLVDTRHLLLYVSVSIFCLFLTVRSLESRRWS